MVLSRQDCLRLLTSARAGSNGIAGVRKAHNRTPLRMLLRVRLHSDEYEQVALWYRAQLAQIVSVPLLHSCGTRAF
jgi:hypothetical protein